jgi:flavin reductase (DIM6/NTAB) family NADH-FMN oxidoreductase RutF
MEKAGLFMTQLSNGGAFLTVAAEGGLNTMTIGWAQLGIIWGRPVLSVMVRISRHTYGLIEKAPDFTVSVPWVDMKKELAFCGSKSGRDLDKFKELDLKTAPARSVATPILQCPGLHYECRILLKTPMDPRLMDSSIEKVYPKKDYHTIYYGQIEACYETD